MAISIALKILPIVVTFASAADIKQAFDGCGNSKRCLFSPPNCYQNAAIICDRFLAYFAGNGDGVIHFELAVKATQSTNDFYGAVGFSTDNEMGDDAVTFCVTSASGIKPLFGYNTNGFSSEMISGNFESTMISGFSGSLADGILQCNFSQKIKVPDPIGAGTSRRIFSLDASNYYLLLASGPYNSTANQVSMHYEIPVRTDTGVYLPSDPKSIKLISKNGCGYDKGCLVAPPGCDPGYNCQKVLTYTDNGSVVRFEVSARKPTATVNNFYAAVGFSDQGLMANASVTACTYSSTSGKAEVSLWHNPGPSHQPSARVNSVPNETAITTMEEYGFVNDVLVCRFTQKIQVPDAGRSGLVVPLNAKYHLLLARGNYNTASQQLQMHSEIPFISSDLIDVTGPFNPSTTPISQADCAVTRGCLYSPDKCADAEDPCRKMTYAVSADGAWITFELQGKIPKEPQHYAEVSMYSAVGYSNDTEMPDTAFTFCSFSHTTGGDVHFGCIPPEKPDDFSFPVVLNITNEVKNTYLKFLSGGFVDDNFICRFQQKVDPPPNLKGSVPSLRDEHYIFLLRGPYVDGYTEKHIEIPVISKQKMNLTNFKDAPAMSTVKTTSKPVSSPASSSAVLSSGGCGGKGCIRPNNQCTPGVDCDEALTYIVDSASPSYISFEASVKFPSGTISNTPYVAVGFSKDTKMGNTAVSLCYYDSKAAKGSNGLFYNPAGDYAPPQPVPMDPSLNIMIVDNISLTDNLLVCKFKQLINPPTTLQSKVYPFGSNLYHIFLARGQFDVRSNGPNQHDVIPFISDLVNLTSTQTVGATNLRSTVLVKKAHGILMIIGWWVFIVNGILIARYFRSVISKEYGGVKLWFTLHRVINTLGLLCVVAAFICIFVARNGAWAGNDGGALSLHSILGLTAVICGLLNPLMALARCHPGTEMRPLFNWAHRTVGISAWCCASAAIFEVTYQPFPYDLTEDGRYKQLPRTLMYIYFIALGLVALIFEELHISFDRKSKQDPVLFTKTSPEPQLVNGVSTPADNEETTRFASLRIAILLMFNIVAISVAVAETTFVGQSDES